MDVEALSTNPSSGAGIPPANQRKERGAIAAQACETCRSRKQKCDEQRPRCGTCQKFKLECRYREPQPTKKDKTLAEILDRLKSLEGKLDSLSLRGTAAGPSICSPPQPIAGSSRTQANGEKVDSLAASPTANAAVGHRPSDPFNYAPSAYRVLSWPLVQQLVENVRPKLADLLPNHTDDGSPSVVFKLQNRAPALSIEGIESIGVTDKTSLNLQLQVPSSSGNLPLTASTTNWNTLERLSKAYFDSFNLIYPIMDRQSFNADILALVFREGFDEGLPSTLACLVFALGEVALSTSSNPVSMYKGRPSGVKGGTLERPPGLAFFNEARKRMGFSLTNCSLENIQMFALAGIYYESCFHHREFWRMIGAASLACQALITSKGDELNSPRGDLIKRIFWHCSMIETCLHLELEIPLSGLENFEKVVGLVDFSDPFCQEDYIADQTSHFREHFLSQIVLRKLAVNFHDSLRTALGSTTAPQAAGSQPPRSPFITVAGSSASASAATSAVGSDPDASATTTARQLAGQLDQWRHVLPPFLRWPDSQPGAFSVPNVDIFGQDLSTTFMFTSDLDSPPALYHYAVDIQVALLRSRYYHAKYLIYRPFVYKAIHHADLVTREDAECVAECFKACLNWPITMSPACCNKRLIPYLCFWSQNILSVLIVLHLSQQVPILARIRTSLCDDSFDVAARETVGLGLDWLRDLMNVDPAAMWFWSVARGIYHVDE